MGWQPGLGLGRAGQGIRSPISVTSRGRRGLRATSDRVTTAVGLCAQIEWKRSSVQTASSVAARAAAAALCDAQSAVNAALINAAAARFCALRSDASALAALAASRAAQAAEAVLRTAEGRLQLHFGCASRFCGGRRLGLRRQAAVAVFQWTSHRWRSCSDAGTVEVSRSRHSPVSRSRHVPVRDEGHRKAAASLACCSHFFWTMHVESNAAALGNPYTRRLPLPKEASSVVVNLTKREKRPWGWLPCLHREAG